MKPSNTLIFNMITFILFFEDVFLNNYSIIIEKEKIYNLQETITHFIQISRQFKILYFTLPQMSIFANLTLDHLKVKIR